LVNVTNLQAYGCFEDNINSNLRDVRWEMSRTGSELFPTAGFGIRGIGSLGFDAKVLDR